MRQTARPGQNICPRGQSGCSRGDQEGIAGDEEPRQRNPGHHDRRTSPGHIAFGKECAGRPDESAGPPDGPSHAGRQKHRQQRADAERGHHCSEGPQRQIGKRPPPEHHQIEGRNQPQHKPGPEAEPLIERSCHQRSDESAGIGRPGVGRKHARHRGIGRIECEQGCDHKSAGSQQGKRRQFAQPIAFDFARGKGNGGRLAPLRRKRAGRTGMEIRR